MEDKQVDESKFKLNLANDFILCLFQSLFSSTTDKQQTLQSVNIFLETWSRRVDSTLKKMKDDGVNSACDQVENVEKDVMDIIGQISMQPLQVIKEEFFVIIIL